MISTARVDGGHGEEEGRRMQERRVARLSGSERRKE